MVSVSLCMIVKNEEEVLERCLKSVKSFVDEIIIVDTGSTDNTKQIAKKYTNKIYDFVWCNDFSKARNFAFSKSTCSYVMWLDADDIVPKKSLNKLMGLKTNLTADVYMLKYDIAFCDNKSTFSYFRERIIKNCDKCIWQGVVHECITPFGKVENIDISIEHRKIKTSDSNRNLKIYQNLAKERILNPREQYYFARELFDHKKYTKCIQVLNRFIKEGKGWVENIIESYVILYKCYVILNKPLKQHECLTKTFLYDLPRANVCCYLGDYFLQQKQYKNACYWYNSATKCKDISHTGAFVEPIYYNYYPYMQLCYITSLLGDNKKAAKFNNLAGKYYKSAAYLHNKKYFENLSI